MVIVRYDEKELTLELKGHAGAGPVGHDLVCAAASMLFYTLCINADEARKWQDDLEDMVVQDLPGDAMVRLVPKPGKQKRYREMLRYTVNGLVHLSHVYPESIKVEALIKI